MPLDEASLDEFMNKMIGDLGGAYSAPLVILGDKLGLYRTLSSDGPMTSQQLAQKTGLFERYVREWLSAQAAAGYVNYHDADDTYSMSEEQAMVLAAEDSPVFIQGAFDVIAAMFHGVSRMEQAFKTGEGVGWHEQHPCLFRGTERFFKAGYGANLVQSWLPALDGVVEKLDRGARVADVGCGHGASTIIMAKAYPNSQFVGYDYHQGSIEAARKHAQEAGVTDRVRFEVGTAKDFPTDAFDLICFFDCLHDMGDPVGVARHVRDALAADGTWMIVEPYANDNTRDNLNPVGRIFYAASTMVCTPNSRSQEVGLMLGAQAGEARLRDVVTQGGFGRFRRATETPFNLILEARA
jgi:2-polyprenyl-3-methyl-5-hydroxy-6-metoxy-1,4-benzoquinol methylase